MFWWATLIFTCAFIKSYLMNTSAMSVITKSKIHKVVPVSVATGIFSWLSLLIVGKISDWNLFLMIADILGDAAGDVALANRWPRRIYDLLVGKKIKKVKPTGPKPHKWVTTA